MREPSRAHRVLITRPKGQIDSLTQALETAGVSYSYLPMLEIRAVASADGEKSVKNQLQALANCDLAIFISTNAVKWASACIDQLGISRPADLPCVAIGLATEQALIAQGWHLATGLQSKSPGVQNSEALLASPLFNEVKAKRVGIVRGVGGRDLLAQTLRARGATVQYCEVYQRVRPEYPKQQLQEILDMKLSAMLFASGETLDNFYYLLTRDGMLDKVLAIPLVVPSRRVEVLARQYGFVDVSLAANASAQAFVQALRLRLGV